MIKEEKNSFQRVCLFGHYSPDYARNRILKKALLRKNFCIVEARSTKKGVLRYWELLLQSLRLRFDRLIVLFPGHTDVPLAWLICKIKRASLIFDAFNSLYDSMVNDRCQISTNSFRAKILFYVDKIACRLANIVILDTPDHCRYFSRTFNVPAEKIKFIPVGSDDDVMLPRACHRNDNCLTVFFYGSFIPLHGIEHIVEAASVLQQKSKNINFIIAGTGQTFAAIKNASKNLENIMFTGWVPYESIPELMAQAHICLGIFGVSDKASRVIPNKVFDALALKKPIITRDSPAIREWFVHGKHLWLVPAGDGGALADAILYLYTNKALRNALAENGYALYQKQFTIDAIAQKLVEVLNPYTNQ